MADLDSSTFNQMFLDRLHQEGGLEKAAALETDIVRQKIWEEGFARKILPPKDVDRNDPHIQEDLNTDTVYYLAHVETLGHAMSCNIRGNGTSLVWYSKKFPISFHKIETEHLTTDEMTIRSMPYPFVKDMEGKFPLWIQMVEDREFTLHIEAAVQKIQAWEQTGGIAAKLSSATVGSVNEAAVRKSEMARADGNSPSWEIHTPQRSDFAYLARMFPGYNGDMLKGDSFLITETDFAGFSTWVAEDIGSPLASKITEDGYTAATVLGYKFMRTSKTSILRPGNVYAFAPKQFGGFFLRFIDATVALERYGDRIETWAWEVIGMGFGNLRFVKKMELFSKSATPYTIGGVAQYDSGWEAVLPLPEDQIVKDNALVEEGHYEPILY